jgi:hypothetical protein
MAGSYIYNLQGRTLGPGNYWKMDGLLIYLPDPETGPHRLRMQPQIIRLRAYLQEPLPGIAQPV